MSQAVKVKEPRKHRAYDNAYPSVTTILGVLRKIALEFWFKVNTIQFINKESGKGKAVGTDIHKAIENYVLTGEMKVETEYPDEVTNALKSFALFRKENPEIYLEWSEMALVSEQYKYNGTIDCIGKSNRAFLLPDIVLDWKTGQAKEKEKPDIYDEYKYQVSAYVKLCNEANGTDIKKAIIVAVAKDKVAYNVCELNEEEINNCFNEVFLPCLKILTYQKQKKENKNG